MAEKKPGSSTGRTGGRHALGRGLGALIPSQQADGIPEAPSGPLDVLFPGAAGPASRTRGGSKRDLLQPKQTPKASRSTGSVSTATKQKPAASGSVTADSSDLRKRVAEPKRASMSTRSRVAKLESPAPRTEPTRAQAIPEPATVSRETAEDLVPVPGAAFAEIPIDKIVPNTRQPREVFDEEDLAELSASIKEVGVLQPIVVRPIDVNVEPSERLREFLAVKPEAQFELIMGERRLRASELAGMESVPAIIRQTEDGDLLRDALLENLHRAQLNPLEEASAYQQLMADFGATQEELAKRIARSRPQIANTLRLLKLPPLVQKKVAAQVLSAGHARALLSLENPRDMEVLAERIVAEGLSVRTTEELVRLGRVKSASRPRTRSVPVVSPLGESVITALQDAYDTRVTITEGSKKGRIIIEFAGTEDLQRIADIILER